jgi:hypothetical protein
MVFLKVIPRSYLLTLVSPLNEVFVGSWRLFQNFEHRITVDVVVTQFGLGCGNADDKLLSLIYSNHWFTNFLRNKRLKRTN